MTKQAKTVICRFYRLIPDAPTPRPADRSADGMLPMRGYRYCEAVAAASAFGWYIYPPLSFSLVWDGVEIAWTYAGAEDWYPLRGAQFPGFRELFEKAAPETVKPLAPPFLAVSREPGVVQIWSGYLARTAPGWALLSRGPANIPRKQGYEHFEGIIEIGNLVRSALYQHSADPHELSGRVPCPLSSVPGAAAAAPMLRRYFVRGRGFSGNERGRLARFRGDDKTKYRSDAYVGALRSGYTTTWQEEVTNAAEH